MSLVKHDVRIEHEKKSMDRLLSLDIAHLMVLVHLIFNKYI